MADFCTGETGAIGNDAGTTGVGVCIAGAGFGGIGGAIGAVCFCTIGAGVGGGCGVAGFIDGVGVVGCKGAELAWAGGTKLGAVSFFGINCGVVGGGFKGAGAVTGMVGGTGGIAGAGAV